MKPNPKGPFWRESSLDLDDAQASFCDACSSVEEVILFLSFPSSLSSSQKRSGDRPNCRENTNAELSCTLASVATFWQLLCSATNTTPWCKTPVPAAWWWWQRPSGHSVSLSLQSPDDSATLQTLRWPPAADLHPSGPLSLQDGHSPAHAGHGLLFTRALVLEADLRKDRAGGWFCLLAYMCALTPSFPAAEWSQSPRSQRSAGVFWLCGGGCEGQQRWAGWGSSAACNVSHSHCQSLGWWCGCRTFCSNAKHHSHYFWVEIKNRF